MTMSRRGKVVRDICWEVKPNFLSRFSSQRTGSALSGALENWRLNLESYWSVELSHVPFYCKLKYLSQQKPFIQKCSWRLLGSWKPGGFSWNTENFTSAFWHCGLLAALYQLGMSLCSQVCAWYQKGWFGVGRSSLNGGGCEHSLLLFHFLKTLLELWARANKAFWEYCSS